MTEQRKSLNALRSIEQALADLREQYTTSRDPNLARMIRQLKAEIALRKQLPSRKD